MNRYQKTIGALPPREGLEERVLENIDRLSAESSRPHRPLLSAIAAGLVVLLLTAGCFMLWHIKNDGGVAGPKVPHVSNSPDVPASSAPLLTPYGEGTVRPEAVVPGWEAYDDITPAGLLENTGCQVVKNMDPSASNAYEAYLIYPEGMGVQIGGSFGGFGVSAVFYLQDRNCLVYSYSFGSGIFRTMLDQYDLETHVMTTLTAAFLDAEVCLDPIEEDPNLFRLLLGDTLTPIGLAGFYKGGYRLEIDPEYEGLIWDTQEFAPPVDAAAADDIYEDGNVTLTIAGVEYEPHELFLYSAKYNEGDWIYTEENRFDPSDWHYMEGNTINPVELFDMLPEIQYSDDMQINLNGEKMLLDIILWRNEDTYISNTLERTRPDKPGVYLFGIRVMQGREPFVQDTKPYTVCYYFYKIQYGIG